MTSDVASIVTCRVADIEVAARLRALDDTAIAGIMDSISQVGLQTPIQVRRDGDRLILVAGAHRLEAHKRLGRDTIAAQIVACTSDEARLREITENLHRAELTLLERDEHIAEWIRLKQETAVADDKLARRETVSKGGRGKTGGLRAAARELGVDKSTAQRAVAVASLSDEAKLAARSSGIDNSRAALLAAAKEHTPDAQVAKINEFAEAKAKRAAKHSRRSPGVQDEVGDLAECATDVEPNAEGHEDAAEQQADDTSVKATSEETEGQRAAAFSLLACLVRSLSPHQMEMLRELFGIVTQDEAVAQEIRVAMTTVAAAAAEDMESILAEMGHG